MDTIKDIGIKIVGAVLAVLFIKWVVERCMGGQSKAKDTQKLDDIKPISLHSRNVQSVEQRVSESPVGTGQDNLAEEGSQGAQLIEESARKIVSLVSSSVQPMKKMANQNQVELDLSILEDVSILESQLTHYNIKTLPSGGIEITLFGSDRDKLGVVIALLKHPAYANKLSQIEQIYFGFEFSFYGHEASVQELFDMFAQFPNLSSLTFHEICDQLVTELHPNFIEKQTADGSNLTEYTFCKGKIKLDMATVPNIESIACWHDSFWNNYLVELKKESKEDRRCQEGRQGEWGIVATSNDSKDAFNDPECPSHQWMLNHNLVIMWLLVKKGETFNAIATIPAPTITVKKWAKIMDHPLHIEIQAHKNSEFMGDSERQNLEESLKQAKKEWDVFTWDRAKEEQKAQNKIEDLKIKQNMEQIAQEKAERHRIEYAQEARVRAAAMQKLREKREQGRQQRQRTEGEQRELAAFAAELEKVEQEKANQQEQQVLEARRIAEAVKVAQKEAEQESNSVQQQEEETPQNNASQAVDVKKDDKARS